MAQEIKDCYYAEETLHLKGFSSKTFSSKSLEEGFGDFLREFHPNPKEFGHFAILINYVCPSQLSHVVQGQVL